MNKRQLHIAAYDIVDDRRRRAAHRVMRRYASSGQKSVFECVLGGSEQTQLLAETDAVIDPDEDRFFIVALKPSALVMGLGRAKVTTGANVFYLG
jgi:CRISPR-associated protein Cas2